MKIKFVFLYLASILILQGCHSNKNNMKFTKEAWDIDKELEEWLEYSSENIEKFGLKKSTLAALKSGIPDGAAPFLGFYSDDDGYIELETFNKLWELDQSEADDFIVFGFDGTGNPICIDKTENDRIILFEHDNDFEVVKINKSMSDFLDCLLIYRNFIKSIRAKYGDDALMNDKYSIEDVEELFKNLKEVDPDLMEYSDFWKWILPH